MPSIRDPDNSAACRIFVYLSSASCLSVKLLEFADIPIPKTKKAGNLTVPGLKKSPFGGILLRAGPTPIAVRGRATKARGDGAEMPLQTHIGRGDRALPRRFVTELCSQGHHLKYPVTLIHLRAA
jgi:hypothetical protein